MVILTPHVGNSARTYGVDLHPSEYPLFLREIRLIGRFIAVSFLTADRQNSHISKTYTL